MLKFLVLTMVLKQPRAASGDSLVGNWKLFPCLFFFCQDRLMWTASCSPKTCFCTLKMNWILLFFIKIDQNSEGNGSCWKTHHFSYLCVVLQLHYQDCHECYLINSQSVIWECKVHCHSYVFFCLQREVFIVQWSLLLWTSLQISTVIWNYCFSIVEMIHYSWIKS